LSDVFAAVCSVTATRRNRFLWAAWWSGPPAREPFRKPDAASGGARSREEALKQAEKAAGRELVEIDGRWAKAWSRVLTGQPAWTEREKQAVADGTASEHAVPPAQSARPQTQSIWTTLGVAADASLDDIKKAFRARARETHPDHGGEAVRFRAVKAAYAEAVKRREKAAKRPRRKAR
jgi:hypothetical protein